MKVLELEIMDVLIPYMRRLDVRARGRVIEWAYDRFVVCYRDKVPDGSRGRDRMTNVAITEREAGAL